MEIAMSVVPQLRSALARSFAACGEKRSLPTPFGSRTRAFWAGCVVAMLAAVLAPSAQAQGNASAGNNLGHDLQDFLDAQNKNTLQDALERSIQTLDEAIKE
jgi:hypothetical protein